VHELFECDICAKFMFNGLGIVRRLMKNIKNSSKGCDTNAVMYRHMIVTVRSRHTECAELCVNR